MNLQETIIQLNELKLRGMSSSFEAMTSLPVLHLCIHHLGDGDFQGWAVLYRKAGHEMCIRDSIKQGIGYE